MRKSAWFACFGLVLALLALAPGPAFADKTVFMSDLHMNLDAPYSWLDKHISDAAAFLGDVNTRSDVNELVILGDLLDEWVYPMGDDPLASQFDKILSTGKNSELVGNLQAVCSNPNIEVSYVTGNHDMLSFEQANQSIIKSYFPEMSIISDDPGLGRMTWDDVIMAEHGHRYCLFNAPDTWSRSDGHLPLGYFITRAVADRTGTNVSDYDSYDLLAEQITKHGLVDELPKLVYEGVALYTGHHLNSVNHVDGLDSFSYNPTVEQVASTYAEIMAQWPNRQDIVSNLEAAINDMGTLLGAAIHQFNNPTGIDFTPRIILFGHTHNPVFYEFDTNGGQIYVNTGTWIDKKKYSSYVEVETTQVGSGKTYDVSLWYYGETIPRHQGSITVE
jgi:UDP-2,3-diacylglucosamine pyrophosphatase LpxH